MRDLSVAANEAGELGREIRPDGGRSCPILTAPACLCGGGFEIARLLVIEFERVDEQCQRAPVGSPTDPTFEGTDCFGANARLLGEIFLRKSATESMRAKLIAKPRIELRAGTVQGAFLTAR